jgi:hypothetical protein
MPLGYSLSSHNPGSFLFDLIYNPAKTLFLQKGEARGAFIQTGRTCSKFRLKRAGKYGILTVMGSC